jgi:hypothetical protein
MSPASTRSICAPGVHSGRNSPEGARSSSSMIRSASGWIAATVSASSLYPARMLPAAAAERGVNLRGSFATPIWAQVVLRGSPARTKSSVRDNSSSIAMRNCARASGSADTAVDAVAESDVAVRPAVEVHGVRILEYSGSRLAEAHIRATFEPCGIRRSGDLYIAGRRSGQQPRWGPQAQYFLDRVRNHRRLFAQALLVRRCGGEMADNASQSIRRRAMARLQEQAQDAGNLLMGQLALADRFVEQRADHIAGIIGRLAPGFDHGVDVRVNLVVRGLVSRLVASRTGLQHLVRHRFDRDRVLDGNAKKNALHLCREREREGGDRVTLSRGYAGSQQVARATPDRRLQQSDAIRSKEPAQHFAVIGVSRRIGLYGRAQRALRACSGRNRILLRAGEGSYIQRRRCDVGVAGKSEETPELISPSDGTRLAQLCMNAGRIPVVGWDRRGSSRGVGRTRYVS